MCRVYSSHEPHSLTLNGVAQSQNYTTMWVRALSLAERSGLLIRRRNAPVGSNPTVPTNIYLRACPESGQKDRALNSTQKCYRRFKSYRPDQFQYVSKCKTHVGHGLYLYKPCMSKLRFTIEQMEAALRDSVSIAECLRKLGVNPAGQYRVFRYCARVYEISLDHLRGRAHGTTRTYSNVPLEEILVENSHYADNRSLKKRLVREGIFSYCCAECGLNSWCGKDIVLRLDHVNGDCFDYRLENLRLLCPNCDSQQPTFCAKNRKSSDTPAKHLQCAKCGKETRGWSERGLCRLCARPEQKLKRPEKSVLADLIWSIPTSQIAKQLGVSDTAVGQWCRYYSLAKPPRGYWQKINVVSHPDTHVI